MTNEELVLLIQDGQIEYLSELWQQMEKFFRMKCARFYSAYCDRCASCGITSDDLMQTCYFVLLDAVKAYNSSSGYKLLTYTGFPMKRHFDELIGIRGTGRNEPLNSCTSLATPVQSTADTDCDVTVGDTIPDKQAETDLENVETEILNSELHTALEESMQRSLRERERQVLCRRYYGKETAGAIAADLGVTYQQIGNIERDALHALRRSGYALKRLSPFIDDLRSAKAYRNTGLRSFKENMSSSVERTAELLEKYADRGQSVEN